MVAIDGQFWGTKIDFNTRSCTFMLLPTRCTMDHQTLDLGLIAETKIRYRSKLLGSVLDVMEMKRNTNHASKEGNMNGKCGLKDGLLPLIGDAIMILNLSGM